MRKSKLDTFMSIIAACVVIVLCTAATAIKHKDDADQAIRQADVFIETYPHSTTAAATTTQATPAETTTQATTTPAETTTEYITEIETYCTAIEAEYEEVIEEVIEEWDGTLNAWIGVVYFNGHKETYYSQQVLPGDGLEIPGRHVAEDGTIRDIDNYICVAADPEFLPYGAIVETSLGTGKVYDSGCEYGTVDIYTNW